MALAPLSAGGVAVTWEPEPAALTDTDVIRLARRHLVELHPFERWALELRYLKGLSLTEVARGLRARTGYAYRRGSTVRRLIARGLRHLRSRLAGLKNRVSG